jgi:hypothetical protein
MVFEGTHICVLFYPVGLFIDLYAHAPALGCLLTEARTNTRDGDNSQPGQSSSTH